MSALSAIGRRVLETLGVYPSWVLARRGALVDEGWFRSYREQASVDAAGAPLPWLTYPAIELLRRRVRADMSVFEYGAGNGTLWWSGQVREVVSVEHDPAWHARLRDRVPANVTLLHRPLEYGGEYGRTAADYPGRFHVVVIDGRDRVNSARAAVIALRPDGVVVWDNSDRAQYAEGLEHLASLGFRRLPLVGLAPAVSDRNETSFLYRDGNCLGL